MDRYGKLVDVMRRGIGSKESVPIMNGQVTGVKNDECSVKIGELEVTGVRLKATLSENLNNRVLIIPKMDSYVLVGSLTGDLKDLCVLGVDEIERIEIVQDGMKFVLDSKDQKLSVENDEVSLKGLFESLSHLLKQFKVTTPAGPSTNILPDTLAAIQQFETDFKKILK